MTVEEAPIATAMNEDLEEAPVAAAVEEVPTAVYDRPEVACITPPDDVHIDYKTNYYILMVRKIFTEFGLVERLPPNPDGNYGGFPKPETQIVDIKEIPETDSKEVDDSNLPSPVDSTISQDGESYWSKFARETLKVLTGKK